MSGFSYPGINATIRFEGALCGESSICSGLEKAFRIP